MSSAATSPSGMNYQTAQRLLLAGGLAVLLVVAGVTLLALINTIVIPVVTATIVAAVCSPLVRRLAKHMPRAMAELKHQLPEVTLIQYPVLSEKIKSSAWLTDPEIMRLLVSEYLKYVFAVMRMHLDTEPA